MRDIGFAFILACRATISGRSPISNLAAYFFDEGGNGLADMFMIHFLVIVLGCRCDLVWHRGRPVDGDERQGHGHPCGLIVTLARDADRD
jgi:hypothetical protein